MPPPWTRSQRARRWSVFFARSISLRRWTPRATRGEVYPLEARTAALHQHVQQLDGVVDRAAVLSLWDRALSATPWPGPPLWLHGDLHPGNLLVSDGQLSGVIDFGDLTSGDPATDLAVLWMLPRSMRWRFEAEAGDEPEALMMRARGWALALGLAYLAHSRDDARNGNPRPEDDQCRAG